MWFDVLVVVGPQFETVREVKREVKRMLNPYDANLVVAEHDEPCECLNYPPEDRDLLEEEDYEELVRDGMIDTSVVVVQESARCPYCFGAGTARTTWNTGAKFETYKARDIFVPNDRRPVDARGCRNRDLNNDDFEDAIAIVTGDGWLERQYPAETEAAWLQRAWEIIAQHPDHWIVRVQMHHMKDVLINPLFEFYM
jgi:hypothetical protein